LSDQYSTNNPDWSNAVEEVAFLFVYGSLKRGYKHHKMLVRANAVFKTKIKTAPHYLLYDSGPFPCLTETPQCEGRCIEGELYQVPLVVIDELDQADNRFERKEAKLNRIITDKPVYVYVYKWSVSQFLDCGTSWPRE
jgi:gamma-glutamylcyclotransferase (GGCT)/AIG2-like uncharacterized protein YtfP